MTVNVLLNYFLLKKSNCAPNPLQVSSTSNYNVALRYAAGNVAKARLFVDADSCNPYTQSEHEIGVAVMPSSGGEIGPFSRTVPFAVS